MNSCLNCKHARFEMTAHTPPRINKNSIGRCHYHVSVPPLPRAEVYGSESDTIERILNPRRGRTIFPKEPYADCSVWSLIDPPQETE